MQFNFIDNDMQGAMNSVQRSIPYRRATVQHTSAQGSIWSREWQFYDAQAQPPVVATLLCLPDAGQTAILFFRQLASLPSHGIRVIALTPPGCYPSLSGPEERTALTEMSQSLDLLIHSQFHLESFHLLGCGLGGYVAQNYASTYSLKVASLMLVNSFVVPPVPSAPSFLTKAAVVAAPGFVLKRQYLGNITADLERTGKDVYPDAAVDVAEMRAVMTESLDRGQLATGIDIMSLTTEVKCKLPQSAITLIESDDITSCKGFENMADASDKLKQAYPEARAVDIRNGGAIPIVSQWEEINMHILVHLRRLEQEKEETKKEDEKASSSETKKKEEEEEEEEDN